jgi:hypothetical protein|tara:strand:- start:1635 stop:1850 length:216 start_codon:yes stop_codon:yes gene_type:complete
MAKLTNGLKLKYSFYSTLVFYILSSASMYRLTSKLLPTAKGGCPTPFGLFLHSIVFLIALYGIMSLPKDRE